MLNEQVWGNINCDVHAVQGTPVDENDPFADLEPDIFEERNEIVVQEH